MSDGQAWVVFLSAGVTLALMWKMSRPAKLLWLIKPLLAMAAGGGFANTGWGRWVAWLIKVIVDWFGSWFGVPGAILLGIAVLAAVIVLIREIVVGKNSNPAELYVLLILPLLVLGAAGPIASAYDGVSDSAARMGDASVARLVGG